MSHSLVFWHVGDERAPAKPKAAPHPLLTMFKKYWFYSKIFNLFHIIIVGMENAERSAAGR